MSIKVFDEPMQENETIAYEIHPPEGGWRRIFTDKEKEKLRPIAETLALLDGNSFFGLSGWPDTHYEGYLQEADAVYRNNGGDNGWAGQCSWIERERMMQEDPVMRDLWNKLQMLIALKESKNETI